MASNPVPHSSRSGFCGTKSGLNSKLDTENENVFSSFTFRMKGRIHVLTISRNIEMV